MTRALDAFEPCGPLSGVSPFWRRRAHARDSLVPNLRANILVSDRGPVGVGTVATDRLSAAAAPIPEASMPHTPVRFAWQLPPWRPSRGGVRAAQSATGSSARDSPGNDGATQLSATAYVERTA
jgi:hypothetical protein